MRIWNFGRNVSFEPQRVLEPRDEADLIRQLDALPHDMPVRVIGAKHAWSPLIATTGALVSLRHLNRVELTSDAGGPVVEIGAGCQIKRALAELNRHGLTLPSVGLISEQAFAGAVATGTHGSGRSSLSHFVESARVVRFDPTRKVWRADEVTAGGDELRAVRCGLGCQGIVTKLRVRPRPQYDVVEKFQSFRSLDDVLARVEEFPLQQFYLLPHRWDWIAQQRVIREGHSGRSLAARLYRIYFHLVFDWGLHLGIKFCAGVARSRGLTRWLFRTLPMFVLRGRRIADRSDCQLIMEHELFCHVETEFFVRESRVREATRYLTAMLKISDGADLSEAAEFLPALDRAGLAEALGPLRGGFTPHYPICYRRVLPDDTLLSMTAGADEPWYAISMVVLTGPREPFFRLMQFLATSLVQLFDARMHWGKHLPDVECYAARSYPRLADFVTFMILADPSGRLRNDFTRRMLT
jgi:FAD/FMN-containing dehydrogenase